MALTHKLVYTFIFTRNHFRVLDAQREREKEERVTDPPKTDCTPAPALPAPSTGAAIYLSPPPRFHHHRRPIHPNQSTEDLITPYRSTEDCITLDWSHPIEIASPSKTDPPETNIISAVVTHDRSRRPFIITHDRSYHPFDLVITHDRSCLNLVNHDQSRRLWPMTDLSLSLHFLSLSLPPSLNLIKWCCFYFCFFKFIYWNFLL